MVAGSLIMVAIIFESKVVYDRVCTYSNLDLVLIAKAIWKHKIQKRPLHTKGLDKS